MEIREHGIRSGMIFANVADDSRVEGMIGSFVVVLDVRDDPSGKAMCMVLLGVTCKPQDAWLGR
jgi:hypothetical protein